MTRNDQHDETDQTEQTANEALPDGQFQDQQMPTTDGEPADPDPQPKSADRQGAGMSTDDGTAEASNDSDGTSKQDGVGQDGTIPAHPEGVAAGHTGVSSTFEPEEEAPAE